MFNFIKKIPLIFTVIIFDVLISTQIVWAIKALKVDIKASETETIFYLRMSQKPEYIKKFTLEAPDRIVIDIRELDWAINEKIIPTGYIKRIRYGKNRQNGRIVLDLQGSVTQSKYRDYPHPRYSGVHLLKLTLSHPIQKSEITKPSVANVNKSKFYSKHQFYPIKRRNNNETIIIVDAGHGGNDPGATSVSGFKEKNIVLSFAKEFANAINRQRNMRAILTRDKDFFIPLAERPIIAEQYDADLFISIHADALQDKTFHGSTIYTLSDKASDAVAAQIAENENKSDIIAGVNFESQVPEVADILIDFMRRETDLSSFEFAQSLVKNLKKSTNLVPTPHRRAGFRVLKSPSIPSVLVELGYLTNIKDERRLTNPEKRRTMIQSMIKAIQNWHYQRKLSGH